MAACTLDVLTQEAKCFAPLDQKQKKAALVWMLVKYLSILGGSDYRTTLSTTLIADSCPLRNLTKPQQADFLIAMVQEAAEDSSTSAELADYTKCLLGADDNSLDSAVLWLICSIKNELIA